MSREKTYRSGFIGGVNADASVETRIESLGDVTINMSETVIDNLANLTIATDGKLAFRDSGFYINSPSSTALSLVSGGTLTIDAGRDITLDSTRDIILSADGDQITMDDGTTTRFTFNLDSTPELDVAGVFTIDCDSDIVLSAAGGNVTMDDGTTTVFDFDVDNVVLKIMDDADTGDYFSIAVAANGATTLSTVDDDSNDDADLTLNADGKIVIEAKAGDEVVFNEGSADVDFRIESDNNANMVFVDGGNDLMHVGENLGKSTKFNTVQDFTGSDPYGFATDGDMGGEIIKLGSATTTLSNLYFLTDSGAWTATDANAESTAGPVLLALALGTNSGTHGMLLRGFARVASSLLASTATAKQGDPIYISGTAGALTFTAPSANNDIVRIVGHLIIPANSNTDSIIYFNPDTTWIKVVA